MVSLGWVKSFQSRYLGNDRIAFGAGTIKLPDKCLCLLFLIIVRVENNRAIVSPSISTLAIERGRVVGREEYLEKTIVGDLTRVELDFCYFGVAGIIGAYLSVRGIFRVSSRVA